MALRKYRPGGASPSSLAPLTFSKKVLDKVNPVQSDMVGGHPVEPDVDIDLREVYFLIMHFLSAGPCKRTCGQFWNELLEHQLLPRRYHAWYSRSGARSGDEDDDGMSLPLCYTSLVERYPQIANDHMLKLMKQLLVCSSSPLNGTGGGPPNAADVPTLLGSGSFSLLRSERVDKAASQLPGYLRWPHMQAGQVRALSLREIGGGFTKHHRAPSRRAACFAIAKPSIVVQRMQIIKKLRGHQNSVYCAIFDHSGRYVITGSDDRLVKIWSIEIAFCLASCRGHEGDITDLAVSSNDTVVASSSNDFIIRVWRLPDGLPISVLRGHTGTVTAIAFNPRTNAPYQLLSSSDDGTCRIWDARYSQARPRIYVPKPLDAQAGKTSEPTPSMVQRGNQILCCAFNANGTIFVTGSSDTHARVWNVCKSSTEDSEQPNHEMDLLSGHENDVNYVQFSGWAVASRSSTADSLKEDNLPKFKNSWFTHDNIVTCSRDGSAIIWIPRSRRSHGKVGRWTRAYHLKVPPPPMPPQPPRGGPRQRYQPTPRGVNMIVWSLDNRFVLAAIMDCRICVWNASDGSLVHSLKGHSDSTFVLDVHPFNPRIAMSASYDGKTIIWDIWEGTPIQIYETGHFKLVDGKFSPDGTSIILSDDVGQIYIIATGQGESQKDAKYDQFFLGDYRPLIQDTHGNVLDQETQLLPYRRNMQDLLCDSSMIPYPEPYQNMYQHYRLGILGIEWRPPSVKFAVGPTYNISTGEYQMLPIVDLDRWVEPLPEFVDAIDWEQENEVQSDDNDSEYNVTDEYSSDGEHVSLSSSYSGGSGCSAEDSGDGHNNKDVRHRSRTKKDKSEIELTTSSGRRVKRRNLDEHDNTTISRTHRSRKLRKEHSASRKKTSKSSRPQRRAARNALNFFSKMTEASTDEEENEFESCSSESDSVIPESNSQSVESGRSMLNNREKSVGEYEDSKDEHQGLAGLQITDSQTTAGSKRKLVLKLSHRNLKAIVDSGNTRSEFDEQDHMMNSLVKADSDASNLNGIHSSTLEPGQSSSSVVSLVLSQNGIGSEDRETGHAESSDQPNISADFMGSTIKWGEVKLRSSKRLKLSDNLVIDTWPVKSYVNGPIVGNNIHGHAKSGEFRATSDSGSQAHASITEIEEDRNIEPPGDGTLLGLDGAGCKVASIQTAHRFSKFNSSSPYIEQQDDAVSPNSTIHYAHKAHDDGPVISNCRGIDEPLNGFGTATDGKNVSISNRKDSGSDSPEEKRNINPTYCRLRIRSKGPGKGLSSSPSMLKSAVVEEWQSSGCDLFSKIPAEHEQNLDSAVGEDDEGTSSQNPQRIDWNNGSESLETCTYENTKLSNSHEPKKPHASSGKMYNAVYKRSKSSKGTTKSESEIHVVEESTSTCHDRSRNMKMDDSNTAIDGIRRTRSKGTRATIDKLGSSLNCDEQLICDEWKSTSRVTVGLRSSRNRRENYDGSSMRMLDKRKNHQPVRKLSWLMLLEHEKSYRYIPQQGDSVAYLRQGHEEYIEACHSRESGPWESVTGTLKAIEFCKVQELEYATVSGSGDSCCKLTLEFIDPSSSGYGNTFKLALPELVSFPDFLVERMRYEAAIQRNWTHRDKCQVWWRNEDGDGGSWWEGRILYVKPKSPQFPESPWERYVIQYRNDSSDHHFHSPWELNDADSQWEHPHIEEGIRDKLLSCLSRAEQTSSRNQDYYGIQKLNQVVLKSDFLNRFPVQLSPEVIKRRLENNYYRQREAVEHDVSVMLSNARTYFGSNAEMGIKMRRLSDSLKRSVSAL